MKGHFCEKSMFISHKFIKYFYYFFFFKIIRIAMK